MTFVDRLRSIPLWEGVGAIVVFLVMQLTRTDSSGIVMTLMGLLLVVLVGFGIINDLLDVLLPVLMTLGIVKSPTSKTI